MNFSKIRDTLLNSNLKPNSVDVYVRELKNVIANTSEQVFEDKAQWHKAVDYAKTRAGSDSLLAKYVKYVDKCCHNAECVAYLKKCIDEYRASKPQIKTTSAPPAITYDTIKHMYDKIKNLYQNKLKDFCRESNILKNYREIVTLSMLVHLPPLRSQDYVNMTLNDIDFKEKIIRINEGKSKASKRCLTMPQALVEDLQELHTRWCPFDQQKKKYITWSTDYLIPNLNGQKMTSSGFQKFLNRLFGKNISTSALRSIYVSKALGNVSSEKLEENAKAMGHSVSTALTQYAKHSDVYKAEPDDELETLREENKKLREKNEKLQEENKKWREEKEQLRHMLIEYDKGEKLFPCHLYLSSVTPDEEI